jgi:4-amino-4-deoxy-L-arabinose transferase-like glycosyltransferase
VASAIRRPAASWIPLGLVLALGLGVRLIFAGTSPMFLEGDSQSYLLPGWELANGYGFSPELRRAPLYPLFIAATFRLFGPDLDVVALAQHIVGLGTVGLTYLIARRLFGTAAAILAGLAVAVSGPQLIYERYLMTEALFGCLLALAALAMVATLRPSVAPSPAKPVSSGVAEGAPPGYCFILHPPAPASAPGGRGERPPGG